MFLRQNKKKINVDYLVNLELRLSDFHLYIFFYLSFRLKCQILKLLRRETDSHSKNSIQG